MVFSELLVWCYVGFELPLSTMNQEGTLKDISLATFKRYVFYE